MSTRILVTIALVAGLLTGLAGVVLIVALAPVPSHAAATPALPTLTPSPSPSPTPSPTEPESHPESHAEPESHPSPAEPEHRARVGCSVHDATADTDGCSDPDRPADEIAELIAQPDSSAERVAEPELESLTERVAGPQSQLLIAARDGPPARAASRGGAERSESEGPGRIADDRQEESRDQP